MTYVSILVTGDRDAKSDALKSVQARLRDDCATRKIANKTPRQETLERQRSALTHKLRALFDEIACEPLPDSFDVLLSQLKDEPPTRSDRS